MAGPRSVSAFDTFVDEQVRQLLSDDWIGDESRAKLRALADGHQLEEARRRALGEGELGERDELVVVAQVVVVRTDDDGVGLQLEPSSACCAKAGDDLAQSPPPREAKEPMLVERVDGEVETADARFAQRRRELGELRAVGRDGDVLDAGDVRDRARDVDDLRVQQRLAARVRTRRTPRSARPSTSVDQ